MSESNRPIETLRDGNLKASIWQNEGDKGPYLMTTLTRTYTDDRGNYHDTNSFSGTDLLRISELARQAYQRSNELRRELQMTPERGNGRDQAAPREAFERQAPRARSRRQPR